MFKSQRDNKNVQNILLILENSLEFDLTKTVLAKLGFHVLWIQKGIDMHEKLSKNFPDLVITSVLGSQDEFISEFLKVREKRGLPKFIWVGASHRLDKLKSVQKKMIDDNLQTPIQPEQLITSVCRLFQLDASDYIARYRALISGGGATSQPQVKIISEIEKFKDPVRAEKYSQIIQNIEKQDKVFTLKDLDKHSRTAGGEQNTSDLFEKKKKFVKTLFKK